MNTKQSTEYFEAGQHFADAIAEIFAKRIRSELEDMVKNYSLLNDLRNSSMTEASQAKDEHKLLLNVKEAAKALGISTRALHNRTAPRGYPCSAYWSVG